CTASYWKPSRRWTAPSPPRPRGPWTGTTGRWTWPSPRRTSAAWPCRYAWLTGSWRSCATGPCSSSATPPTRTTTTSSPRTTRSWPSPPGVRRRSRSRSSRCASATSTRSCPRGPSPPRTRTGLLFMRPTWAGRPAPGPRAASPFVRRPFGDGGYLDNKPFGYAVDALTQRRAGVPVQRKLLYIEPAPEHLGSDAPRDVNVLENVHAALLTLPRYETI